MHAQKYCFVLAVICAAMLHFIWKEMQVILGECENVVNKPESVEKALDQINFPLVQK